MALPQLGVVESGCLRRWRLAVSCFRRFRCRKSYGCRPPALTHTRHYRALSQAKQLGSWRGPARDVFIGLMRLDVPEYGISETLGYEPGCPFEHPPCSTIAIQEKLCASLEHGRHKPQAGPGILHWPSLVQSLKCLQGCGFCTCQPSSTGS